MNWYKIIKFAEVYGEYWIMEDGNTLYADDNYNHEGHVMETVAGQHFEMDCVDSPDLYEITNMDNAQLAEVGMSEDEIRVIRGDIDAREFAMKNWGWVRVADRYVQSWILDSRALKRIADGLYDAFQEEAFRSTFVLENISSGKNYSPVPYAVIDQGSVMGLRQFQEWDPEGLT